MPTVLILANETIAGRALLDRIRERSEEGARFFVVVPQTKPRHGNVTKRKWRRPKQVVAYG